MILDVLFWNFRSFLEKRWKRNGMKNIWHLQLERRMRKFWWLGECWVWPQPKSPRPLVHFSIFLLGAQIDKFTDANSNKWVQKMEKFPELSSHEKGKKMIRNRAGCLRFWTSTPPTMLHQDKVCVIPKDANGPGSKGALFATRACRIGSPSWWFGICWWFRCVASWRSPCIDEIWPTKSPINLPSSPLRQLKFYAQTLPRFQPKKTPMTRLWPPFGTKPKWSTNSEKMSPIYPSISSYDQRNCNVWRSIQKQSELMLNIYEPSCVALLPLNKWKWHRIFTPHRVNSPHFAISVVDWTILIFTILFNIFNHTIFIELHLIFTIEIDHLFTTLNH